MNASGHGVVHVAYGAQYLAEAAVSAASVKATNPSLGRLLITNQPPSDPHPWDEVLLLPDEARGGGAMKLQMHRAPWDRCLFLDTDTLVIGDLGPVFQILDRFDLAGVQYSSGLHYRLPGLPDSFPEFNSGVLAWRRNEKVRTFFQRWSEFYTELLDSSGRNWDQKSLRLALYESELRIADLPYGYNLMPYFPAIVEGPAVVLHGRNPENLQRLQDRLARSNLQRTYIPGLGVLSHPQDLSWSCTITLAARMFAWRLRASLTRRQQPPPS